MNSGLLGARLKPSTSSQLVAITVVNLLVVAVSSVLAIYGDGTAGGMFWVLGLGTAWVLGFAAHAFKVGSSGDERRAVRISGFTLPLGFLAAISISIFWRLIQEALATST